MEEKSDFRKVIQDFVKDNSSISQIQFILEEEFRIEAIDDQGLVNYVFRVLSRDGSQSVIIKYGEEKLRVPVPGIKTLPLRRQEIEFDSLVLLADIYPGSVPQPYCFDKKHQIIAMEDLMGMETLGAQLGVGKFDSNVAANIGKLLATIHNKTSRYLVPPETWKQLETKFMQAEIKDHDKRVIYIEPFREDSPTVDIPEGGLEDYRQIVDSIKTLGLLDKLTALHDMNECFIHADSHWNHLAIFPGTERIALFDFEISYIGHPCHNLTSAIFGIPLFYHAMGNELIPEKAGHLHSAKLAIRHMVDAYLKETEIFKDAESQSLFISNLALLYGSKQFSTALFSRIGFFLPITTEQRIVVMKNGAHVMEESMKIHTSEELVEAIFFNE